MRQLRRMIGDRVDGEEHGAWDVTGAMLGQHVAFLRHRGIGGVDHDDVAIAQMLGEPFGRFEPAARRRWGGIRLGSQHFVLDSMDNAGEPAKFIRREF
jgi:hypothetical protein